MNLKNKVHDDVAEILEETSNGNNSSNVYVLLKQNY